MCWFGRHSLHIYTYAYRWLPTGTTMHTYAYTYLPPRHPRLRHSNRHPYALPACYMPSYSHSHAMHGSTMPAYRHSYSFLRGGGMYVHAYSYMHASNDHALDVAGYNSA